MSRTARERTPYALHVRPSGGEIAERRNAFLVPLLSLAETELLCLACPYFSMDIIEQLVARAKAFRILSDVEEWLAATPSSDRKAALDFIRKNVTSVRHFSDLHCKLALSKDAVWFGSANFTSRGMFELEELCFSSTDREVVQKCRSYFDRLWQGAVSLRSDDLHRLEERIHSLPDRHELRRILPRPLLGKRGDERAASRATTHSQGRAPELAMRRAAERALRELYTERSAMQQQALEDLL